MDPMGALSDNDALERFETIWEHVECGISIIDAATREILDINPVAARMFGDDKEKIVGKRCHKFICPSEEHSCPIMDKNQTVDRSERKFIRADGEMIPIIKSVAKINYNGRLVLLESFTDISNLKKAEERLLSLKITEQANQAKSDFLSRMSHEMRTPMNAIIGMTRIAHNSEDVEKLKYCLSTIGASSAYLLNIINDVLDMSKIEAGKLELHSVLFNMEKTLMQVCEIITEKVEQSDIEFNVRLGESVGMRYIGDEQRLSQVLLNLLSNAVKFTPRYGAINLTVEETRKKEDVSLLRFTVSDTGIGMSPDQLGKLFNAFEQTDSSIARRFGGTGLGLAIAKSIVEKMGGAISVVSELGKGSVFTVEVELGRPRRAGETSVAPDTPLRAVTALVASGSGSVRESFSSIAGCLGMVAEVVESGGEALRAARSAAAAGSPYSVVFLDYALPDMNGIVTAGRINDEGYRDKIVLLSPFLQWNSIEASAREAGVRHFAPKPLFPTAVAEAVAAVVGARFTDENPDEVKDVPDFSHVSLLLAEDVALNREIFRALLEETQIRIDMAENGRIALDKFKNSPGTYDIIIMDMQMPEMDGFEATRIIRGLDLERAKTVPIIAMTASAFKEDIEKCLAGGMNDHLAKPIDERAVIDKIRRHCGGKSSDERRR